MKSTLLTVWSASKLCDERYLDHINLPQCFTTVLFFWLKLDWVSRGHRYRNLIQKNLQPGVAKSSKIKINLFVSQQKARLIIKVSSLNWKLIFLTFTFLQTFQISVSKMLKNCDIVKEKSRLLLLFLIWKWRRSFPNPLIETFVSKSLNLNPVGLTNTQKAI